MKKTLNNLLILAVLLLTVQLHAQIKTPAASPSASVSQTIGLTDIMVEYSRPGVKERTIFAADGLVPYGKVWRTGANAATKLKISDDIKINGADIAAGTYAVLTVPSVMEWEFQFYPYESGNWGSYVEKTPSVKVIAKPTKVDYSTENFLVFFDEITAKGGKLNFIWDHTLVSLDIDADADVRVMESIDKVLSGPSNNDYYAAASYYYDSGKDLNKALEWVTKATSGENPKFWQLRKKALILAKLGKKKEAIATAQQSLELAKVAGNDDYVRMNKASISEWK